MRKALFVLVMAAVCLAGGIPAVSAVAAEPQGEDPEQIHINLSGVTLHSIVQYISRVTRKPVLLPDPFPGASPVDIVSGTGAFVSRDAAMGIFSKALSNAGFAMVEGETYIRIVPEGKAKAVPVFETSPDAGLAAVALAAITVDVQNAEAGKLVPLLSNLKSSAGRVESYADSNQLVITDYGENRRSMLALLKILDKKLTDTVCDVVKPESTSVGNLRALVTPYVNNLKKTADPLVGKRLEAFSVETHAPTNSFILFGHPEDIAMVKNHIRKFDVKADEVVRKFHTYAVLNRDTEELRGVLESLLSASKTRQDAPETEPAATIIADVANSALIVVASPEKYAEILPVIQELDAPRAQVEIEAALVELSTEKMADIGVELATMDGPGENPRGFAGSTMGLSDISEDGRIPILPSTGGLTAGVFKNEVFNMAALVRLAAKDEDISFIAAPRITTVVNKPASVRIAEKREFEKSIISPEGRTSEVSRGEFNEAEILLEITPHINKEGTVRLEITTTTQQFLPGSTTASGTPLNNIASREATTEVNVPDGKTAVIAGLTRTVKSTTIRKVPILGDIPLVRFFFRRKEDTHEERNLCIFITPHVLADKAALIANAERWKDELKAVSGAKTTSALPGDTFEKVTGGRNESERLPNDSEASNQP